MHGNFESKLFSSSIWLSIIKSANGTCTPPATPQYHSSVCGTGKKKGNGTPHSKANHPAAHEQQCPEETSERQKWPATILQANQVRTHSKQDRCVQGVNC
jgi:hypothetical protein